MSNDSQNTDNTDEDARQNAQETAATAPAADAAAAAEATTDDGDTARADAPDGDADAAADPDDRAALVKRLEAEGDYAADYLEELLDIADLGGDIDIDVENDRASVAIVAEGADMVDLKRLVGQDGQVLEALQELTRLAVQQKTGERSRLMLDIADFRANKKRELTAIAEEAITKVKSTGQPVKLDPMNPFERKVCHDVAAAAGCFSESEGQSPHRYVIISLRDDLDDDDE